jgi:hypothetical protein
VVAKNAATRAVGEVRSEMVRPPLSSFGFHGPGIAIVARPQGHAAHHRVPCSHVLNRLDRSKSTLSSWLSAVATFTSRQLCHGECDTCLCAADPPTLLRADPVDSATRVDHPRVSQPPAGGFGAPVFVGAFGHPGERCGLESVGYRRTFDSCARCSHHPARFPRSSVAA